MNNKSTSPTTDTASADCMDAPMLLRSAARGGFLRTNASFEEIVGFSSQELKEKEFLDWIEPTDRARAEAVLQGTCECGVVHHISRSGISFPFVIKASHEENQTLILARHEEADTFPRESPSEDEEATLADTLHSIAEIIEDQNPGYHCSILLLVDGKLIRGAAPSLAKNYYNAIDNIPPEPTQGSCGAAVYWNVPVIVENIQTDPLWRAAAGAAEEANLAACWSYPFTGKSGKVLGAVALYSAVPGLPTPEQLSRLKAKAGMIGLAVDRGRAEEAIREKRKRELELEAQLRQSAKMKALGVLAGGIAHDFNNVLAMILSNAEFARDTLPANAEAQCMLTDIIHASKRAGQFCQQLLAYAGQATRPKTYFEIEKLIPEVRRLVQAGISKKTALEFQLLHGPFFVKGDENQMLQVLMNLVSNAADAIQDKQGKVTIRSQKGSYTTEQLEKLAPDTPLKGGEYLTLEVEDNGVGMTPETVACIFDPFFTTKPQGHGLGLSAVKGIIQHHEGAIQIESTPGEGALFRIILPFTTSPPIVEQERVMRPLSADQKKILIAEDEDNLRSIFARVLKRAGFEVVEACDGNEAVELFSQYQESIDCALIDLSMPGLNGEETMEHLLLLREDLPIVLMSGYSGQELLSRIGTGRVAGCLQKPISNEKLVETIRSSLEGVLHPDPAA